MTDARIKSSGSDSKAKSFPKTDVRHWRERLFKRSNDDWHVQVAFGGRQERFPLKTPNKEAASAKARDIYLSLHAVGWEATLEKFKPWASEAAEKNTPLTVGEFIAAVRAVAPVRPTTFTTYERKFRFLVSQILAVEGSRKRYDYVHGGSKEWRAKIDAAALESITPEKALQWRVRYINEAKDPMQQNAARQTAASILRNAKALFSPKLLRNLSLNLPSPLPFDGVDLGKRPRTRYKSKVNPGALVQAAHNELKDNQPELFKVFLLAIGAGLRRGEIDRLSWKQFDWNKGTLRIEATEYGDVKTESSDEEIDIGADMLAYFKEQLKKTAGDFVVASSVAPDPKRPKHWNHYRCDRHFKDLIEWLHTKGVESRTPLHTLRKEFGSLINQKFGIFAASAALRHSNISITREHYVDRKERIALDLTELVKAGAQ